MPIIRSTQLRRRPAPRVQPVLSDYERFAHAHPEFMSSLTLLRREWQNRLHRLAGRNPRSQRHEVRRLLRSNHLAPLFAFEAIKKGNRLRRAAPATVQRLAEAFNPFAPVRGEHVEFREIARSGAYNRLVHDFGPIRRMHQYAVSNILLNLHPPPEEQKLFNGGMPMALSAIETAFSNGATHGCEIDFVNFYGSVQLEGLADFVRPLPNSVTQHVVWDMTFRQHVVTTMSSVPTPTPEQPQGLSLGSATSPIVGEIIIARLLAVAQLDGIVTYADNMFVYGQSEVEVLARIQRLRESIASAEFGCSGLSFRTGDIRLLGVPFDPQSEEEEERYRRPSVEGIDFANHFGFNETGEWVWTPSHQKLADFQIGDLEYVTLKAVNKAIVQVSNWRRYYKNWPDGDRHEAAHISKLKTKRYLLDRTPTNLSEAISAVCNAFLAWDCEEPLTEFVPEFVPEIMKAAEKRSAIAVTAIEIARERRRA